MRRPAKTLTPALAAPRLHYSLCGEREKLDFLRKYFVRQGRSGRGKSNLGRAAAFQRESSSSRVHPDGRTRFGGCPIFTARNPPVLNQARAVEKRPLPPVVGWSLPDDSNIWQLQIDPESATEAFLL